MHYTCSSDYLTKADKDKLKNKIEDLKQDIGCINTSISKLREKKESKQKLIRKHRYDLNPDKVRIYTISDRALIHFITQCYHVDLESVRGFLEGKLKGTFREEVEEKGFLLGETSDSETKETSVLIDYKSPEGED